MSAASGQWTLGVLIGAPLAIFAAVVLLAWAAFVTYYWATWRSKERGYNYALIESRWATGLWMAGFWLVFLGFCGGMVATFWPFDAEYHQYRTVKGTVATIANRLVSAGDKGGTNQKFVVVLTSGPQQYGIEDTRAALLKPGGPVALRCIRVYEYGSSDAGYDCKWGR